VESFRSSVSSAASSSAEAGLPVPSPVVRAYSIRLWSRDRCFETRPSSSSSCASSLSGSSVCSTTSRRGYLRTVHVRPVVRADLRRTADGTAPRRRELTPTARRVAPPRSPRTRPSPARRKPRRPRCTFLCDRFPIRLDLLQSTPATCSGRATCSWRTSHRKDCRRDRLLVRRARA